VGASLQYVPLDLDVALRTVAEYAETLVGLLAVPAVLWQLAQVAAIWVAYYALEVIKHVQVFVYHHAVMDVITWATWQCHQLEAQLKNLTTAGVTCGWVHKEHQNLEIISVKD